MATFTNASTSTSDTDGPYSDLLIDPEGTLRLTLSDIIEAHALDESLVGTLAQIPMPVHYEACNHAATVTDLQRVSSDVALCLLILVTFVSRL